MPRLVCALGALLGSLAHAQDAGTLSDVLQRLSDKLDAPGSASCSFVEKLTIEELDSDDKPTAREIRTFRVEESDSGVKRTFVGVKQELGELDSKLRYKKRADAQPAKDKPPARLVTPFHRAEQQKYRFKSFPLPGGNRAVIAFEPLERDQKKSVGSATLDVDSMQSFTIGMKPSEFPVYLSEMDSRFTYAETACGFRPTRIEAVGEGGILFVRMHVRTVLVAAEHATAE